MTVMNLTSSQNPAYRFAFYFYMLVVIVTYYLYSCIDLNDTIIHINAKQEKQY